MGHDGNCMGCIPYLLSPVIVTGTPTQFESMTSFAAPKTVDYRTFDGYLTGTHSGSTVTNVTPSPTNPGLLYSPFLPRSTPQMATRSRPSLLSTPSTSDCTNLRPALSRSVVWIAKFSDRRMQPWKRSS